MYSAVTRKGMRGYCLGTEECVTIKEAVRMMTYNGACLTDEEHIKGSIEPGKLADIVLLNDNLVNIDNEKIRNIMPVMTMIGGKIVYKNF
jgi:predicted amidohydrolase YtcJ